MSRQLRTVRDFIRLFEGISIIALQPLPKVWRGFLCCCKLRIIEEGEAPGLDFLFCGKDRIKTGMGAFRFAEALIVATRACRFPPKVSRARKSKKFANWYCFLGRERV